jgi:hypothetical protein
VCGCDRVSELRELTWSEQRWVFTRLQRSERVPPPSTESRGKENPSLRDSSPHAKGCRERERTSRRGVRSTSECGPITHRCSVIPV